MNRQKMTRAKAEALREDARDQLRRAERLGLRDWADAQRKRVEFLTEYLRYRAPAAAPPRADWRSAPHPNPAGAARRADELDARLRELRRGDAGVDAEPHPPGGQ